MRGRIALAAALVVAGTTSAQAESLTPNPVTAVYRLSHPVTNRQGDVMNYVSVSADNRRTYWNNVPQGMQLSPGVVTPPNTTFSRSRTIVQNGTEYSIDSNTGGVTASISLNPTAPDTDAPAVTQDLAPDPVTAIYRLSSPVTNRQGDVMNYVAIAADNKRTYWNNVPQGMKLSPGLIAPPNGALSRSNIVVQKGWKHSVDAKSGIVAGSIPLN